MQNELQNTLAIQIYGTEIIGQFCLVPSDTFFNYTSWKIYTGACISEKKKGMLLLIQFSTMFINITQLPTRSQLNPEQGF